MAFATLSATQARAESPVSATRPLDDFMEPMTLSRPDDLQIDSPKPFPHDLGPKRTPG